VVVDYISSWVEAITSPTNDARLVSKFFKRLIFPRFEVSRVLISKGGIHFKEQKFEARLTEYGVHHKKGLGYHPETSSQGEVSNREIKVFRKEWWLALGSIGRTSFMMHLCLTPHQQDSYWDRTIPPYVS